MPWAFEFRRRLWGRCGPTIRPLPNDNDGMMKGSKSSNFECLYGEIGIVVLSEWIRFDLDKRSLRVRLRDFSSSSAWEEVWILSCWSGSRRTRSFRRDERSLVSSSMPSMIVRRLRSLEFSLVTEWCCDERRDPDHDRERVAISSIRDERWSTWELSWFNLKG